MTKDQIENFLYEMSNDLLYNDLQWIDNLSCASPSSYYTNAKERARQKSRERSTIIQQIMEKIPNEQL